jgi:hypothetical protein
MQFVNRAYDWSYRLSMDLHYRSCGRTYHERKPSGDDGDLTEEVIVKTEIRATPHAVLKGVTVVEVWHDGKFLATIAGTEGPGVRVITKHGITAKQSPDHGSGVNVLEVSIKAHG